MEKPQSGEPLKLRPDLISILAPNPSPMTYWGTNTYIVGEKTCYIVDPGPQDEGHMSAILTALSGKDVAGLIVTHAHHDHSDLVPRLANAVDAPIIAFGNAHAGRNIKAADLLQNTDLGGGEGVDESFAPDICVANGQTLPIGSGGITILHTPGHMGNHICLLWEDVALTGDHIMGWASTLISPPDGDYRAYLASCEALLGQNVQTLYPGHGAPVLNGPQRIQEQLDHRHHRHAQIQDALSGGPKNLESLAHQIYHDVPPALWPAAMRNVLAHLLAMMEDGIVQSKLPLSRHNPFILCEKREF